MAELKKSSVKSKVEAVLFSIGHKISLDYLIKLCRSRKEDVVSALHELKGEYDQKQSSLMLVEEGDFWKFTVRDHLVPIIRKIVTETELTKSVLETLAVIAFKYPILQSDLIKLRTNKAYDHLIELEKAGYISRQKHGRTNLIKLTDKFFKYFDLTEESLKEKFSDFASIAKAIKEKEEDVEKIKEEQRKRAEDLKKQDEKIKEEIESLDEAEEKFEVPLETYEAKPKGNITLEEHGSLIVEKEKFGDLEIVKENHSKNGHKAAKPVNEEPEQKIPEVKGKEEAKPVFDQPAENEPEPKKKSKGIHMTPEMEAKADQKVEELLHGGKENKEEKKEE